MIIFHKNKTSSIWQFSHYKFALLLLISAITSGSVLANTICPVSGGKSQCVITQGNSSVLITADNNGFNVDSWSIGGVNQAFQAVPLYDRSTGFRSSDDLDTIEINTSGDQVIARYEDIGVFDIVTTFTLSDIGSNSILEENFVITSQTNSLLQFRALAAIDFNLNGNENDEQAVVTNINRFTQIDGLTKGVVEIIGITPDAFQVASANDILNLFSAGGMPTLNSTQVDLGLANYAQVFQSDFDLNGIGQKFTTTIRMTINPVPLPPAFLLFGSCILGLYWNSKPKII